jgi:hypothetical protein
MDIQKGKPEMPMSQADSFQDKYLDLAMTEDFLPSDSLLNKLWGSKNGTLSSVRSRMKKVGFELRPEHGGWVVEKRPAQKPELSPHKAERSEQLKDPEVQFPIVYEKQDAADAADARREPGASVVFDDYLAEGSSLKRLDRIIEQQGKIIDLMGPMFGVMKKLADAWGASA